MLSPSWSKQVGVSWSFKIEMKPRLTFVLLAAIVLVGCASGPRHWTTGEKIQADYLNSDLEVSFPWATRSLKFGVDANGRILGPKCALTLVTLEQAEALFARKGTRSYPSEIFRKLSNPRFASCYRNYPNFGNFPEICGPTLPKAHSISGLPNRPSLWNPHIIVWSCPIEGRIALFVLRDMVLRSS